MAGRRRRACGGPRAGQCGPPPPAERRRGGIDEMTLQGVGRRSGLFCWWVDLLGTCGMFEVEEASVTHLCLGRFNDTSLAPSGRGPAAIAPPTTCHSSEGERRAAQRSIHAFGRRPASGATIQAPRQGLSSLEAPRAVGEMPSWPSHVAPETSGG